MIILILTKNRLDGDLSTDSPNYYPYEELIKMSPEELEAIGYPNPFEFQ